MSKLNGAGKKTALITGASTGIGRELAKLFAKDSYDLILVARSEHRLNELATSLQQQHGITATVIALDLAHEHAAEQLYTQVEEKGLHVDVLVNNAGFGQHGAFLEMKPETDRQMLQLNMVTLTELSRKFGARMVQKGAGRILNVASTAAFMPGPFMSTYYASKAYVLSLSEAMNEEFRGTGVTVTALCPGLTMSEFHRRAGSQQSRMMKLPMMTATDVARLGYRAMNRGRPVVVSGMMNQLLSLSVRFAPRCLITRISKAVTASAV